MNDQQIYIDTVRQQVQSGAYDHLLTGRHDMVVLDIGANIGIVSKFFIPHAKRIVAIEPAPDTFRQLQKNCQSDLYVDCYQVALAPIDGPVEFFVNDINFTASSTVNTYGDRIVVEGKRLSTILRDYKLDRVDVCKCDAEGAEGESLDFYALQSAKDIIKTYYIEVHNCPKTTWEHKLGTLVGNLARNGYTRMSIDGMAITAKKP